MSTTAKTILANKSSYPGNDFMLPRETIKQVSWRIGDVADMLELTESQVRFYGDILDIKLERNRRNYRIYREKDITLLISMVELIKVGFTVTGAAEHVDKVERIIQALA